MKSAWRTLGYINYLDENYLEAVLSENEYFQRKTGQHNVARSVKKSIIYHEMLDIDLENFKEIQYHGGIVWVLPIVGKMEQCMHQR